MTTSIKCTKCFGSLMVVIERTMMEPFILKSGTTETHELIRIKTEQIFESKNKPNSIRVYCPRCKRRFYSLEHSAKIVIDTETRRVGKLTYDKKIEATDLVGSDGTFVNDDLKIFFNNSGLELRERPRDDNN